MATKEQKLLAETNRNNIVKLALQGMNPSDIAEELELQISTVRKHLNEALSEAREVFVSDAPRLLVKNYMRTEVLIDRLMGQVMEGCENELAVIDRIDKLIKTNTKLILGSQPIRVQIEGGSTNTVEHVFRHESPEYKMALNIATQDPNLALNDPIEKFKGLAEKEGYEYIEAEYGDISEIEEMAQIK